MYLPIPIGIIPIELIERVKFIKAPLRLNPCRLGNAYESDKSRHLDMDISRNTSYVRSVRTK